MESFCLSAIQIVQFQCFIGMMITTKRCFHSIYFDPYCAMSICITTVEQHNVPKSPLPFPKDFFNLTKNTKLLIFNPECNGVVSYIVVLLLTFFLEYVICQCSLSLLFQTLQVPKEWHLKQLIVYDLFTNTSPVLA